MAMDSAECNGSAEARRVELEGRAGGAEELGSGKDLAKSDGIAPAVREAGDQDEIGGPYVIINADSDNPSPKVAKLEEKVDSESTADPEGPSVNGSNGIGDGEVELGEKVEDVSQGAMENGELSENRENNFAELGGGAEMKGLSEGVVNEEVSQDDEKDRELGGGGDSEDLSVVTVVGDISHESGQECELNLAADVDVEMHQSKAANGEHVESEIVSESGEKEEEERPVSGSIEGVDEENGRMHESETIVEKPIADRELDVISAVEEQVPQEVEHEVASAPSVQIVCEESGALPGSDDVQEEEVLVSASEDPTLNSAVEEESEQKHEIEQDVPVPSKEEENHEELQGLCDSLQESKEVEMTETESEEPSLSDTTVGDSELKHELQQVVSGPSQVDEQREVSEGVSDSMQSNEESGTPGTDLNKQSPLDSAVKVESEQKLEERQETSIVSQDEEMHEETEAPVPSEDQNGFMEASKTDLKELPSSDFETGSRGVDGTTGETKIEDQDMVNAVCNGKDGESETSPSSILFEKDKHALSSTSPSQEKLAESETKQENVPLEANGESEVPISDAVADENVPSDSTKEVEEMQNSERSDAAFDAESVSLSHKIEVDSSPVIEVEPSSEILADSENKGTSDVEESDRSVAELEDGKSKTETETISVSSNDTSAREIGLEDSVQIGKFKISIGENGPSVLQHELQESSVATEAATPEEPGTSTSSGEKTEGQQLKRQAIYIIKVPRHSDEEQWEKIQEAQARLDELTRTRDAIRDIMQKKRKACSDSWDEVLKAKEEERAARAVFNAKRHEISTVQSVINKLNKANSIDDMDDLIDMKEKSLQHETRTLKQEKMLIQEIKELKVQRKKLIDNMGSAAEIDEAFDQKDSVFDKLKMLKAELDVLGKTLTKAEAKTRAAQKDYDELDFSFCNSQDEYKSADEVRQKAYLYWRDLKSELAKKNKHFFNYRDDQKRAANFLNHNPPDTEGVRLFCNRQVERMMDLWNSDAEFRKQYIKSNQNSTLRRLRTPDGRSLGPDEVPPVIPMASTAYRRTNTPMIPATKEMKLEKSTRVSSSISVQSDDFPELPQHKPNVSHGNSRNNKGTSSKEKSIDESVVMGIVTATTESAHMEKKWEEDEMERRKREEEERARREEDIKRKAKAEAEEKERLREEQKAKAKEAEERKKRKAEKAQERAAYKARREAEIRDKKRSKKDKKKIAGGESDNGDPTNSLSAESSSPSEIAETRDVPSVAPMTATRRPTRPQAALKQLKRVEPVPVALRNRGRRKRSWVIGILVVILALLLVFLLGNYNFSHISSLVWL